MCIWKLGMRVCVYSNGGRAQRACVQDRELCPFSKTLFDKRVMFDGILITANAKTSFIIVCKYRDIFSVTKTMEHE